MQPIIGADTHASISKVQYNTVQYHFLELPFQFIISASTDWADNNKRQIPSREWNAILLKIRLFCNVTLCRLVTIVTDVSQKLSASIYKFEFGCASEDTKLYRNVRNYTSNGTMPLECRKVIELARRLLQAQLQATLALTELFFMLCLIRNLEAWHSVAQKCQLPSSNFISCTSVVSDDLLTATGLKFWVGTERKQNRSLLWIINTLTPHSLLLPHARPFLFVRWVPVEYSRTLLAPNTHSRTLSALWWV